MPTYLVHGFRWLRPNIRIHIIINGLDDAAAEWLCAPATTRALKNNLLEKHPHTMNTLRRLRFVEQYDPLDESGCITDYAYVADFVHEVKLDADIDEIRGQGVSEEQWDGIVTLRDILEPLQKIAWFIVVCGDLERSFPRPGDVDETEEDTIASSEQGGSEQAVNNEASAKEKRPASRTSHIKDDEKSETAAAKAKRSNSFTRSIRKMFTSKEPKETKVTKETKETKESKETKETKETKVTTETKEKPDRGREVKKSRSLRSFRSFGSLRSSKDKDSHRSEGNSPEPLPPLPGTAK